VPSGVEHAFSEELSANVREHAWGDGSGVRCAGACSGKVPVLEAALAAALAENALESERKERTVGSFEHTPQHLYDVDDPCFGFVESSWSCSGGGDWGDYDHDSS
jgi:hypothetical protein